LIAGIIGTARHHDIEISLLVSQLESSTLTADLALRMAEHVCATTDWPALADLARTPVASLRGRHGAGRLPTRATALSTRLADGLR
jgi:hypothetical protein